MRTTRSALLLCAACLAIVVHDQAQAQPASQATATPPAPVATKEACLQLLVDQPEHSVAFAEALGSDFRKGLESVSRERHDSDAKLIATNKRHVVMAYAAMWLLAVGFLAFLWHRQRGLVARLGELEARLSRK